MTGPQSKRRCAIYTRKSSDEGLEQSFNSLHAQREACEAYILSQRHEGWQVLPTRYDDGGFSGGNMEPVAPAQVLIAAASLVKLIPFVEALGGMPDEYRNRRDGENSFGRV